MSRSAGGCRILWGLVEPTRAWFSSAWRPDVASIRTECRVRRVGGTRRCCWGTVGLFMQGLMHGKRGLIMGVANDHSIAWGIARTLAGHGAKLGFTYQGEALGKRVRPLAQTLGAELVLPCDVEDIASVDRVFETIGETWGGLDFLVHAIAFSDKTELKGRYADTTRANFIRTMLISCLSFTEAAKRAAALMTNGGAMITLTYNGGTRAMPNYNAMGLAKHALAASVAYPPHHLDPRT